jgi:hypothetical protein
VIIVRATLNIPDELISEVVRVSGEKSKTKAVIIAMQEFVRQRRLEKLLALEGKIDIDYDWKKEEELELKAQEEREGLWNK